MTLRALIFDVDGTLAETEEAHRDAFNRAFADLDLDWTWDKTLYRDLLKIGGGRERVLAYAKSHAPDFLARGDIEDIVARVHDRKTVHYGRWLTDGNVALRPGVERLIGEAGRAGVKVAIATTSRNENVVGLLKRTLGPDGPKRFAVIAAAEAAAEKKPAPDVYLHALRAMDLSGADCLAIEDSSIGLAAARAAGIPVLITEYHYTAGADLAEAMAIVSDLGEPGHPCRFVRGDAMGKTFVDLDLLKTWHAQA